MAEEMKENNIKSFSGIPLKLNCKKFKFGWGIKTFLLCLLLSCALCLPSMFLNGGMFTYMGDYNAQQIPFYVHCHQAIRERNIIWDWGTELGTSFLGSYTYYTLCSPFFWFTLLFPTSWVPYLMGPLLMLKFALSGLAAYLYLKNHVKEQRSAFFGGILYAFSGWSVYNVFYNQFHESFIVFPLLLLALDNLVEKKQYGFFALMVAVSAFVNYYFFVGMAVFCVLYWLIRTIMKSWNMSVKKTVIIAVEAILGTLCAMFILLPSAITVFSMDRTAGTIMGWDMLIYPQPKVYLCILQSMFFPAEIPAIQGFIYCKETAWQSLTLYLPFIGMVGVFTWFRNKFKSWQSILLLVCAIFAFVPILNASFTMFQPVYYARWYMMPILIMCLVSVKAAEEFEVQKFKGSFSLISLITLLTVAVFAFCPHIEDGKWVFGLFSRVYPVAPYLFAIWSAIAILQILSTYTLYRKRMQEKLLDNNKVLRYLSLFIVGVCFFTSVFCYGVGDGQRTSSVIKNAKSAYSVMEDENARINIVCGTGEMNYNMLAGRDSVSCFQSLTSDGAIKFYKTMFNFTRTVTAPTLYSQTEAATMLSVRYMYVKKASVDNILKKDENEIDSNTNIELVTDGFNKYGYALNDGFTLIAENDEYCVYENKNYLSYGIPYTQYISEADYQKLSKSEQSEVFLKALVVHENDIDKISDIMTPYIPDEVKYEDVCTSLKDKTCDTFVKTSNGFNASITVDKPTYIMFSVPYEENAWTATINGENADIVVVDGGLMAIRVNSGVNNIVFEYKTPGFELGAILSCTAAFLLLIYCAIAYASKKFIKI